MLDLPRSVPKRIALFALAIFFVGAGVAHFVNTEFFVSIVPPYLPAPLALVQVSGVFEILGGLGVLLPATRRLAGWGLVALLFAVYPANLHMAFHPEAFVARGMPLWGLYLRLPVQFVFVAWTLWATWPPTRTPPGT
jgi:uncharacterized membrane protein